MTQKEKSELQSPAPPDFLVIGAREGKTIWLHRSLRAPDLDATEEVRYFDRKMKDGSFGDEW